MDDHQLQEVEEEYYNKNKSKLDKLKSLLEEEFQVYEATFSEPKIDYGEKGHIMLEVYVAIKGKFFNWKGEKLWLIILELMIKNKLCYKPLILKGTFNQKTQLFLF